MGQARRTGWLAFATIVCGMTFVAWSVSRSSHTPTFAEDVAPIVFDKCASCHHPGEAAPFNLLTYDDVKHRARQIVDVTQKRFMPPWLPKQGDGDFVGARQLSDQELQAIRNWVDAGMPMGDAGAMPGTPVFLDPWAANAPDLVIETPEYKLESQDRDVFRNFV